MSAAGLRVWLEAGQREPIIFRANKAVFLKYEDQLMSCLMLLPVALLVFGLIGSLVVLWKKKYRSRG